MSSGKPDLRGRLRVDAIVDEMLKASSNKRASRFKPELNRRSLASSVREAMRRARGVTLYGERQAKQADRAIVWRDCERLSRHSSEFAALFGIRLPKNMRGVSGPEQYVGPMRLVLRTTMGNADEESILSEARLRASELDSAITALSRIADEVQAYRTSLEKGRQNPGALGKLWFTLTMADWWVEATGKLPGAGRELDQNPFLRFLQATWADVFGQEDENFVRPLLRALPILKGDKPRPVLR